jgi:hypothetical protein
VQPHSYRLLAQRERQSLVRASDQQQAWHDRLLLLVQVLLAWRLLASRLLLGWLLLCWLLLGWLQVKPSLFRHPLALLLLLPA